MLLYAVIVRSLFGFFFLVLLFSTLPLQPFARSMSVMHSLPVKANMLVAEF